MAKEDKYKEINAVKNDKLKALDAAISQIEKQYGKGSIMKLGDNSAHMNVETIPTGSLSLDIALGLGGLPKGRIIEIYGPESSGKTTVALHAVAEVQKRGGIAGFIDAEHALDPVYAKNIGVDIDNLYISQPDCGEQALEITETMVRSGAVDEDNHTVGFADDRSQLTKCLAHQSCLKSDMRITHISINLCLWNECCHGVDDHDINRPGTYHGKNC